MTAYSISSAAASVRNRLWVGVLSAPAAWLFVEIVGYVASARQCSPPGTVATAVIRATQLAICAIGVLVAANGLRMSLGERRALRSCSSANAASHGRRRFMALAGVMLGVLFIGGIILFAIGTVFLDLCERAI